MESSQQLYPSLSIQVYFASAFSVITVSMMTVGQGFWSLQSVIVHPVLNSTADSVLHAYAGITNYEYEMVLTISVWSSVLMVFLSGILLDNIGMPIWSMIVSCLAVCGSSLTAFACTFPGHHLSTVAGVGIGASITYSSAMAFMNIRYYIDIQYFQPNYQSVVIAIHIACVRLGAMLAFFIFPQVGEVYGVSISLWILAVLTFLPLICCSGIFAISKLSKQFQSAESSIKQITAMKIKISLFGNFTVADVIRTYRKEFWLVMISSSITRGTMSNLTGNIMKIMTVYYRTSISKASEIVGVSFASEVVVTFLTGLITKLAKLKIPAAVVGLTVMLLCESLFTFLQHGSPFIFLGFAWGHGISITSLMPLIKDYVPYDYLGFAVALVVIFGSITIGSLSLVFGFIFKFGATLTGYAKWKVSFTVVSACGLISFTSMLILVYMHQRSSLSRLQCCSNEDSEERVSIMFQEKLKKTALSEEQRHQ